MKRVNNFNKKRRGAHGPSGYQVREEIMDPDRTGGDVTLYEKADALQWQRMFDLPTRAATQNPPPVATSKSPTCPSIN